MALRFNPPPPPQVPGDSGGRPLALRASTLPLSHFWDLLGRLLDSGSQALCRVGPLAPSHPPRETTSPTLTFG